VKLRKAQSDRVYREESEFAEVTEPTKLRKNIFTTMAPPKLGASKPDLQNNLEATLEHHNSHREVNKTTSASRIHQLG
jgi:hypothetical protein